MNVEQTKPTIFFAGPYQQQGMSAVKMAVSNAAQGEGYLLTDVSAQESPVGWAITDTINAISSASIVVAEVSKGLPAVMIELGIAKAKNRPIVLLADDPGSIPFDFRDSVVLLYSGKTSMKGLSGRLRKIIRNTAFVRTAKLQPEPDVPNRNVFFSYSHKDGSYLERMLVHLRPVERAGAVDLWSDTNIQPGDKWKEEIRISIDQAQVAVLLISADFLASEFIASDELPPLLAKAQDEGTRIIPVIVKPSRFLRDEQLCKFQALNDPLMPLIQMKEAEQESLYAKLAETIEVVIGF